MWPGRLNLILILCFLDLRWWVIALIFVCACAVYAWPLVASADAQHLSIANFLLILYALDVQWRIIGLVCLFSLSLLSSTRISRRI